MPLTLIIIAGNAVLLVLAILLVILLTQKSAQNIWLYGLPEQGRLFPQIYILLLLLIATVFLAAVFNLVIPYLYELYFK